MTTRPKLTRSQRAQVVELLRCGADACIRDWLNPGADAVDFLGAGRQVADICTAAVQAVDGRGVCGIHEFRGICLEAAARVEAGEWP